MHLKISSAEWRPFCPGEDELKSDVSLSLLTKEYKTDFSSWSHIKYSSKKSQIHKLAKSYTFLFKLAQKY